MAEAGRENGFSCLLTSSISAFTSIWVGLDITTGKQHKPESRRGGGAACLLQEINGGLNAAEQHLGVVAKTRLQFARMKVSARNNLFSR